MAPPAFREPGAERPRPALDRGGDFITYTRYPDMLVLWLLIPRRAGRGATERSRDSGTFDRAPAAPPQLAVFDRGYFEVRDVSRGRCSNDGPSWPANDVLLLSVGATHRYFGVGEIFAGPNFRAVRLFRRASHSPHGGFR